MNASSFCFIGPQEIAIIGSILTVIALVALLVIVALIKFIKRPSGKSQQISDQQEKETVKLQGESLSPEEIRDYYPVREGSRINLIRFDEIVDFSADNNYVFLTDIKGKDYLAESSLAELESKLPKEFMRVHKSTIINSKLIGEIKKLGNGRYDLIMKCGKDRIIACSKNYNENIKTLIDF